MKAKIVNVIMTESTEGKGTTESPVCVMKRYWTLEGVLIAEHIYMGDTVSPKIRNSEASEHLQKPDRHQ